MKTSTRSPLKLATRLALTAALSLPLVGLVSTPAEAIILKYYGTYSTKQMCDHEGILAMRREHADGWKCYPGPGKFDGYVYWNT